MGTESESTVFPPYTDLPIEEIERKAKSVQRKFYKPDDPIPWHLALLFGFQVSSSKGGKYFIKLYRNYNQQPL